MQTLGFNIKVDSSQVQAAKQHIDLMNTGLRESGELSKLKIEFSGLDTLTSNFAALTSEIKNLRNFSFDTGKLDFSENVQQIHELKNGFSVAGKSVDSIATGATRTTAALTRWKGEADKLHASLKQIREDMAGLQNASHTQNLAPSTRQQMITELSSLEAQRAEKEKELSRVNKRVEVLESRPGAAPRQRQENDTNHANHPMNPINFKRLMGWGAAAVGVAGIGSLISSSRSAYRSAIDEESPLFARGLRGTRKRAEQATVLGIAPQEWYGLENTLSRNTGLNEKQMPKNAMLTASFAKFSGLDTQEVAGLRSNLYNATGNASTLPNSVLVAVGKAQKDGIDKSRLPELLHLINRNTAETTKAMGGAGISDAQTATALSLAIAGLKDTKFGTFAKSQEFAGNVMQNGMQGAGTPAGEIMLWDALGGFKGPMDFEKVHEMNVIKQGGFMEKPELLQKIMGQMSGSKEARAGQLESFFPAWDIKGKASGILTEMFDSGFLAKLGKGKGDMTKQIETMSKGTDKQTAQEASRWLDEIKKNPALGRQVTEATKDIVKIEAGEKLSKLFEPIELAAAKFTGALADGDWKKSFSILDKAAGEMGGVGKILLAAGGLYVAGGAMNFMGGAMSMVGGGKGAMLKMLPGLLGVGGPLAALTAGYGLTYAAFKDGAQGANYLPEERKNAITGKEPIGATAFAGKLNSKIANDPKYSKGYKEHAVSIYEAAQKWKVPENILAGLIESESDFTNVKPRQINLKNGKKTTVGGVAQFTEETAKQYKIDRMNPAEAIDGAGHLLRDNYKKTGDWRGAIKAYKGVESESKMYQVDTAIKKAEKYTDTEAGRQVLTSSPDTTMQMLTDILKVIAGHSEQTALNTGARPSIAIPLAVH